MTNPAPSSATSTGLAPNLAGALSYLLGPLTGVLFLVLEKDNRFVRFHAMQSTILGAMWIVLSIVLNILLSIIGMVPVIGWIVAILVSFGLGLVGFVLWLLLMWKAWQGQEWEVPVAGPIARQQLDR